MRAGCWNTVQGETGFVYWDQTKSWSWSLCRRPAILLCESKIEAIVYPIYITPPQTRWVYCWGPKEIQCQVWSYLDDHFHVWAKSFAGYAFTAVCSPWCPQLASIIRQRFHNSIQLCHPMTRTLQHCYGTLLGKHNDECEVVWMRRLLRTCYEWTLHLRIFWLTNIEMYTNVTTTKSFAFI